MGEAAQNARTQIFAEAQRKSSNCEMSKTRANYEAKIEYANQLRGQLDIMIRSYINFESELANEVRVTAMLKKLERETTAVASYLAASVNDYKSFEFSYHKYENLIKSMQAEMKRDFSASWKVLGPVDSSISNAMSNHKEPNFITRSVGKIFGSLVVEPNLKTFENVKEIRNQVVRALYAQEDDINYRRQFTYSRTNLCEWVSSIIDYESQISLTRYKAFLASDAFKFVRLHADSGCRSVRVVPAFDPPKKDMDTIFDWDSNCPQSWRGGTEQLF
jgi:hypothetical protein